MHSTVRGALARMFVAEDARWLVDVALSSRVAPGDVESLVGLGYLGHFARVAYEGARVARHPDPHIAIPQQLSDQLPAEHSEVLERARHAVKLLDDAKKSLAEMEDEFAGIQRLHHAAFTGNAPKLLRWLETDLGVFSLDRRLVLATATAPVRFGMPLAVPDEMGTVMNQVSVTLGQTIIVLAALDLRVPDLEPALDLSPMTAVQNEDHLARRYLEDRFDPSLPEAAKLLLLMIEGDVNLARLLLPMGSQGHEGPVRRARFIAAWHALSGIDQLLEAYPSASGSGSALLREMLAEEDSRTLLDASGAKALRNQFVHYVPRHDLEAPPSGADVLGWLVESLWPGETLESVDRRVDSVLRRVSDLLAAWRP